MKKFSDLREAAPAFVREPAAKAFWNKSVLLNPKNFSEPTKDDKMFKATNIKAPSDHMHKSKPDDQSQGYTRPIIMDDYLNHLLNMESLDDDEIAFVESCANLDEADLDAYLALPIDDVDQIDEISKGKLAAYAKAASSSSHENSASNLASRGAYALGHDPHVSDAGEKDDKKSGTRSKFIGKAIDRLHKEDVEPLDELMAKGKLDGYIASKDQETDKHLDRFMKGTNGALQDAHKPAAKAQRASALKDWDKAKSTVNSFKAKQRAMRMKDKE